MIENNRDAALINNGIRGLKISGENLLLDGGELWRLNEKIRDMDFLNMKVRKLVEICQLLDKELTDKEILERVALIEGAGKDTLANEISVLKF